MPHGTHGSERVKVDGSGGVGHRRSQWGLLDLFSYRGATHTEGLKSCPCLRQNT